MFAVLFLPCLDRQPDHVTLTVVWFVTTSQQWAVFSNGCPSFCSTQQTICHLQCSLTMNLLLTNSTENFLRIMLCFEVACNIQAECVEWWLIRTVSLSLSFSLFHTPPCQVSIEMPRPLEVLQSFTDLAFPRHCLACENTDTCDADQTLSIITAELAAICTI